MTVKIGLISVSDRASRGVYEDRGIPALEEWLSWAVISKWQALTHLIADEAPLIEQTLLELIDGERCPLVLTTGGTGPAPRDVTPDATLRIAERVLPGFGEEMRRISLHYVPTAILSRQVAVLRGSSLIINLPGQPRAIAQTLEGIFLAVPDCIALIGGPVLELNPALGKTP